MIGKIIGLVFLLVVVYFAWDFMFAGSDGEENMIQNLQKKLPLSDNPAIRHEQQYNPGKDQYLTQNNPSYQNIPPSQRPWNP
jgi:hypothetical protein